LPLSAMVIMASFTLSLVWIDFMVLCSDWWLGCGLVLSWSFSFCKCSNTGVWSIPGQS
jgi:hypothetical protein